MRIYIVYLYILNKIRNAILLFLHELNSENQSDHLLPHAVQHLSFT